MRNKLKHCQAQQCSGIHHHTTLVCSLELFSTVTTEETSWVCDPRPPLDVPLDRRLLLRLRVGEEAPASPAPAPADVTVGGVGAAPEDDDEGWWVTTGW